jgi:general secretion pathway protein D
LRVRHLEQRHVAGIAPAALEVAPGGRAQVSNAIGGGSMGGMGMQYGGMYGGMGGMGGAYGGMYNPMGGSGFNSPYASPYAMGNYGGAAQLPAAPQTSVAGTNTPPVATASGSNANPVPARTANDLTGSYLGLGGLMGGSNNGPTVIPNPFDNTILVRSTPQEWEQIRNLLRQIDLPPRQVLIDAKIYEVDLTGSYSAGFTATLQKRSNASRALTASSAGVTQNGGGLNLSLGALVLQSHEILTALAAAETSSHTRLVSSPSIVATDSIPAVMNVGQDVPVLTSQAIVGGVQSGGTNLFTNTVSNRSSGVTLSITARINSSGVVTKTAPLCPLCPGEFQQPYKPSRHIDLRNTQDE